MIHMKCEFSFFCRKMRKTSKVCCQLILWYLCTRLRLVMIVIDVLINVLLAWNNTVITRHSSVNTLIYTHQHLAGLELRVCNEKIIFLFLDQNICCGYSKEPSQWDGSFELPKHMLKIMGKKIFTILSWKFLFYLNLLVLWIMSHNRVQFLY